MPSTDDPFAVSMPSITADVVSTGAGSLHGATAAFYLAMIRFHRLLQ
jgi:hypothetical protein